MSKERAYQLAWRIVDKLRLAGLPAGREAREIIEKHLRDGRWRPRVDGVALIGRGVRA